MSFTFAEPTQTWLEISPKIQTQSWAQCQSSATLNSRWNGYLNHLCLSTLLPWLQEEFTPEAQSWLSSASCKDVWEVVNGGAINLGEKRLVIIPTEDLDTEEFRVPQEWVDLPSWMGDYYLAVQVELEEQWIRVWGYTTHQGLKQQGNYDFSDRSYVLAGDDLTQDLTVLSVKWELGLEETTRVSVTPISSLELTQGENLLQRLGDSTLAFPRLAVPFSHWGALLEQEQWRRSLAQQRRGEIQLHQWFQNTFHHGWQSLESLFPQASDNLSYRLRRISGFTQIEVKGVRLIPLPSQSVILLMGLSQEVDGRTSVWIKLCPQYGYEYLPIGVTLTFISASGEIQKSVTAAKDYNLIQLNRFKCPSGQRFSVQVSLDEFRVTESFEV